MAASMVSTRIFLSIPFSLATCSRMNPRLVSMPDAAAWVAMISASLVSLVLRGFLALGLRRKLVNRVSTLDSRPFGHAALSVDFDGDARVLDLEEAPPEHPLPVGR